MFLNAGQLLFRQPFFHIFEQWLSFTLFRPESIIISISGRLAEKFSF